MSYAAKTNWAYNEVVPETDLNRIEQGVADATVLKDFMYCKSAAYNVGTSKIDVTIGPGIIPFLQTIVVKATDTVYNINAPAINTSYYIYLSSAGAFSSNTTGIEVDGAIMIWKVSTGAALATITLQDLRGLVNGSAQTVKDLLDAYQTANNAAVALKLNSTSYTAADILAKLLTVDGAGSGVDADTLDGVQGALFALLASPAFSGNPTVPNQTLGDNSTKISNTAFVQAAIANLINGAPGALDTLLELATAMGNDPNFATTITNALALKASIASLNAHAADYSLQIPYIAAGGVVNVYTATLVPAMAAYTAGVALSVNVNITNTGAATINVNGLGAKAIKDSKGNAMIAGKLRATSIYTLRYNGTDFILQGDGGGGTALAANIIAGLTATVDSGDIVGTMVDRSGTTQAAVGSVAGTTLSLTNPGAGYLDTASKLSITDADFIAANFPNGIDIFGLVGTGTNAKRTATGTLSSSASSVSYRDNVGVSRNFPSLIVSGLSFKPSVIYIYRSVVASGDWAIYTETNDGVYTKHVYLCDMSPASGVSTTTTQYSIKGDVAPASVVNGSFQLPVNFGSTSYTWIAYE